MKEIHTTSTGVGFGTAVCCMDGRIQLPVIAYLRKRFSVAYIDMITEPGPVKILAEAKDIRGIEAIRQKVELSVVRHNSLSIAVVAHHDCAGNPEGAEVQQEQLRKAVEAVRAWGYQVNEVIAVWVDERFDPSEKEGRL